MRNSTASLWLIMYKAVIFDLGNTLAASASLTEALESVVESNKSAFVGEKIESEIGALYKPDQKLQPDWKVIWENCFNEAGLFFSEDVGRQHLEAFCSMSKTFPQVVELLSELKQMGIKLGLLSNVTGPYDIFQRDLDNRGLSNYFNSIIWSSAIGYRKPCRKAFEIILADLGVEPKDALMIGDSEIADIGGAINIGMDSALISEIGNLESRANYQVAIHNLFDDVIAITKPGSGREKHAPQL